MRIDRPCTSVPADGGILLRRQPFDRILVANRGEIAVRILRAARECGLSTVAVHSSADANARHVREADRSMFLGPAPATESYLCIDKVIDAARESGAGAVHPGYGFLAENAALPEACEDAGLVFVGPPAAAMRAMGDKAEARQIALKAGVPVVPGYEGDDQSDERLTAEAKAIGFPVLIKPSAGGGGKGMKRIESEAELALGLESARREARSSFGNDRLVLERYLDPIRHVEIQVFGDATGVVHLFERECSVQRRHQKIIEEAPSPALNAETRAQMGAAAVRLAAAVGYRSAGTVEFILAPDGSFYFLEMNTRLQVEHPVTELTTGIDLAHAQLREAMGGEFGYSQSDLSLRGHAIEFRIYAEDPDSGFLPSVGRIAVYERPEGPGVRFDSGIDEGAEVTVYYDPILAKLVVWGADRDAALLRARRALAETVLLGVRTNLDFLQTVTSHPVFTSGNATTRWIDQALAELTEPKTPSAPVLALAAVAEHLTSGAASSRRAQGTVPGGDPYSPWEQLTGFRIGGTR